MDNDRITEQLRLIEDRLTRIEERLSIAPPAPVPGAMPGAPPAPSIARGEEEIEFELGQNWFAKVGIVVLALGMVFLLTFPYTELPAAAPGIIGYALAGSLFLAARVLRASFDLVSRYLRGAGMVLLFFTTLRLFYFGPQPVLEAASGPGIALLLGVLGLNTIIALRRGSAYLFSIALATGYAAAVAVGTAWFVLPMILAMSVLTVVSVLRTGWTTVLVFGTVLAYLTHLIWAMNNPILGNPVGFITGDEASVFLLLLYAGIFSAGALARKEREKEGIGDIVASFLNGGGSYGVFLLHTAVSFGPSMVATHLSASAMFLGLATVFWVRERSRFSTFAYVMLGYMALSVAIIKSSEVPEMFVWLSVQSLIVVATAVWFRSRFIVVANFIIYLSVVIAYVAVGGEETGISIGIGIVALASARILNWQRNRLELKTEMMRNAYLASAFTIFPYATYHLVPAEYISLSWLGLAGFYYLMNLIVRAQKYRWMGHLTILLTVLYVLVIGIALLTPTYRIISFLVLGTVLLAGSLIFTRLRAKRRAREAEAGSASIG
ncbi:MAG TPA: hypothetical protein VI932_03475 [Bacteroidota bacterium]|nr:hypothetical protein [Bacteroidota bacterium]